ncbi:hypothetical protein ACFOKF_16360 [Sphingobium rhizovicinum]|uniref:DUF2267 domain-containing protein n=1 Tax=Sphingobium rhizovicinum TaxID=432308 RepID=A0ABV7NK18_9SPHN
MSDPSDLEEKIESASEAFAAEIGGLATRSFVREGILKQAVVSVIWALFREMPEERDALADILDDWPSIIRDANVEDKRQQNARSGEDGQ